MYYNNEIYPYFSQLLNEAIFWVYLSKEHPIFIKKISDCQNINIGKTLKKKLNKNYKDFNTIGKKLLDIKNSCNYNSLTFINNHYLLSDISIILNEIIKSDMEFLNALKLLEGLSSKDRSWKTFINHITIEQRQLLQICSSHLVKIKSMGY